MVAFRYQAFDAEGKETSGIVDAESSRAARSVLRDRGLLPSVVLDLSASRKSENTFRASGMRDSELCLLTNQWSTLLSSGLTMEQSLSALMGQADRAVIRDVLAGIRAEILGGYSLQAALDRFGRHFPPMYRASIAAGEKSGELAMVMTRLADYLEQRNALRQKTLQALLYPMIVAFVALIVVIGLMTYVVPSVVTVFQQGKQALPWLTRVMIVISDFLRHWGWLMGALAVAGIISTRYALRKEDLRRRWDARLLKLPLCGPYLRTLEATRFASTLSILVRSGIPLLAALEAGRQVVTRLPIRDAIAKAAEKVSEGLPLSRSLGQTGQFPPLMIHMISSGEATGQLDTLLERAAKLQQADLEHRTTLFTTLMEPILLLVMGGVVMIIVLAVMQPIIEINQMVH